MIDEIRSRAAALLEPIPGAAPAGQAANLDSRYEAVRNELAKLDAPTGGEIDWKTVGGTCRELLTGVTKDFLLASQHAYAQLQLERWAGLATGLAVIDGMLERWWDEGFPPVARLRGRGNALDWLTARLEIALPSLGVQPTEVAAFEAVRTLWSGLGARARERLGEFVPAMGGVGEALERLRINLPAAAQPTPAPAAEPAATTPAAAEPAASTPAAEPAATTPAAEPAATTPAATTPAAAADDPLAAADAKAEAWLAPIAGAKPAGSEARYDPAYEAARLEVTKLEAITDQVLDWKLVHDNATMILKTKSKDLLVASYLAFAKLRLSGIDELVVGLQVISGLLDRFWDGLEPERLRGRANAVGWLVAQLEPALGTLKLEPKQRSSVLALQTAVHRLSGRLRDRMAADGPSLGPVTERVQRMLLAVPEEKPAPPPPPASPAPAPTPAATAQPAAAAPAPAAAPVPTAKAVTAVDNPEAVGTFLQETGRALVSTANMLRAASNANPLAYRLLRTGLYLHIAAPPPSDGGGKTQIPAVPAARRTAFATMEQNGKWEALLEESESALQQARFCLDFHRLSAKALEHLGDAFTPARTAIIAETASLLARMPTLSELIAREGTPLCDADTKTWLSQVVLAGSGGSGGGGGGDAAGGDDDAGVFAQVRGMITGGKASEAMRIATARIDAATTHRQRFGRRLLLAQVLLETNSALLSRGMFAALERELRERGLLEWEPELAGRVLEGFVRAIRAAAKAGARYEQADAVYERLCLVDPIAAARLAT
ncbi:MAG: type VI secretion system protein TssA [Nannocystaceae bacterium]|nr:type VI secretion system protein TssA [Nannocystaceae bacterium]